MRPALLLHNVIAGRHGTPGLVAAVAARLAEAGYDAEPRGVDASDAAVEAVRAAVAGGAEAVFALGGDGTVRDAATGLYGSAVPLGVIPAGTTNVVARALGLPVDALAAARLIARGLEREMDVGLCAGKPFLMQATAGFDASVLAIVDRRLKARFGRVGIVFQGLGQWWRYAYPKLELHVDGREVGARQVAVCNISEYGGSFRIVPEGRFDDRQLDVVLFHGRGRRATLSFYVDMVRGVHGARPDTEILPAEVVEILGPAVTAVQIDGDPLPDPLPLEIRLAPERLRVLAPAR